MSGPKARMDALQLVERVEQLLGEFLVEKRAHRRYAFVSRRI